jgi:MtN3 and saliva related transmembrane protein
MIKVVFPLSHHQWPEFFILLHMLDYANLLVINKYIIGISAGVLTSLSLLPQLAKIVRDKHVGEISLAWLVILLLGLSLWTWYAWMNDDWPLFIANLFSILINIILIIFFFRYGRQKKKQLRNSHQ